jgi:hypothetical protein
MCGAGALGSADIDGSGPEGKIPALSGNTPTESWQSTVLIHGGVVASVGPVDCGRCLLRGFMGCECQRLECTCLPFA